MGGYDSSYSEETIREAWEACIEAGVVLFDTAEIYGSGESERIIGRLLASEPSVRDRWSSPPSSCRARGSSLSPRPCSGAARASLATARHRVHRPVPDPRPDLVALTRRPGRRPGRRACRGADQGRRRLELLGQGNEVDRRRAAQTGAAPGQQPDRVLAPAHHAREGRPAGVLPGAGRGPAGLFAHRPGPPDRQVLGRQPTPEEPRPSRTIRWSRWTDGGRPAADREAHGERTPSQVALAWIIAKGAVPIPGAKSRQQAEENAGALGWRMEDDEVAALDAVALYGKRGISQRIAARLAARLTRGADGDLAHLRGPQYGGRP